MAATQLKKTILTDDGELREITDTQSGAAAVYCSQCGTASRSDARFCRNCGHPLSEEIEAARYTPPEQKSKRTADQTAMPQSQRHPVVSIFAMLFNLIKLFVVIGAVTFSYHYNNGNIFLPIVLLVAWIMVEGLQAGAMGGHTK